MVFLWGCSTLQQLWHLLPSSFLSFWFAYYEFLVGKHFPVSFAQVLFFGLVVHVWDFLWDYVFDEGLGAFEFFLFVACWITWWQSLLRSFLTLPPLNIPTSIIKQNLSNSEFMRIQVLVNPILIQGLTSSLLLCVRICLFLKYWFNWALVDLARFESSVLGLWFWSIPVFGVFGIINREVCFIATL